MGQLKKYRYTERCAKLNGQIDTDIRNTEETEPIRVGTRQQGELFCVFAFQDTERVRQFSVLLKMIE